MWRLVLLALLLAGTGCKPEYRSTSTQYEYHTGKDGALLWRCDRRTGQVKYCVVNLNGPAHWTPVLEQQLHPEPVRSGDPDFEPATNK